MGPVRGAKALYKLKNERKMKPIPPHNKTYFGIFHSPLTGFFLQNDFLRRFHLISLRLNFAILTPLYGTLSERFQKNKHLLQDACQFS